MQGGVGSPSWSWSSVPGVLHTPQALQCLGAGACSRLGPLRPGFAPFMGGRVRKGVGGLAFFLVG